MDDIQALNHHHHHLIKNFLWIKMKPKGYKNFPRNENDGNSPIEPNGKQFRHELPLATDGVKIRKKKSISLANWTRRILGTSLFIFAVVCCFKQIHSLTEDFLRHEVIESISDHIEDFVEPPNFSFCFDILSMVNSTQLLERHPDILEKLNQIRLDKPQYRDWPEKAILHDYTIGPGLVFNLSVAEIYELLPRFSQAMTQCRYLNSSLRLEPCDESFFDEYFFNQMVCNEFKWRAANDKSSSMVRFPFDGIKIPGFQNTRFLALYLDLTHLLNVTVMSIMAHSPVEVSWDPEASSMETYPESGEAKIYGLSYHKTARTSLTAPHQSNCTDFKLTPYKSRQDCLQSCSVKKFIKTTKRIPRYAIIREFDENKILYEYQERESHQELIQNLSEHCNRVCGTSDCHSEDFTLTTLYSPRQSIRSGKRLVIHIYPPTKPDTAINTAPSLTFQYYFASIGGTLGIWFGFSFYSLLIFTFDALPKIYYLIVCFCRRKQKLKAQEIDKKTLSNQTVY